MCPRQKRTAEELTRSAARRAADKALDTLVKLLEHPDGMVKIAAAEKIVLFAYGPAVVEPADPADVASTVKRGTSH